ncbi:hypothetical protein ACT3TP_07160 [Glutamicibacter sp. AOP38-B1-38]|uniref:hypothetical protein n=1 Tax=Micrococcaceae TaxID=1268 RepID=UPI0015E3A73D|nr:MULTISPECIES: hypothetical protein [unclassified Arthrobacter]
MEMLGYEPIDFLRPLVYFGVAVTLVLICFPTLIHGLIRRGDFQRKPDGLQTYALKSSIRTELIVAGASGLLAIVCTIVAASGYFTAMKHLEANIALKYEPTSLDLGYWNGSWATTSLVLPDGTSFSDVVVEVREAGEPFIEEIWYHERKQGNQ